MPDAHLLDTMLKFKDRYQFINHYQLSWQNHIVHRQDKDIPSLEYLVATVAGGHGVPMRSQGDLLLSRLGLSPPRARRIR